MRKEPRNTTKKQNYVPLALFVALLALVLVVVIVFAVKVNRANAAMGATEGETVADASGGTEKWQEGVVSYNGQRYLYNNSVKTYLFMGIDRTGTVEEAKDGLHGGQSDAMFLLVLNPRTEKLSVIAIHRNTMTDIETYDEDGNYLGMEQLQICLQHGYGDGMRVSSNRSVKAVSRLFYNLPINGYLSLNMDGIAILNDLVGGVTVTLDRDLENAGAGVSLKGGETVRLTGQEANVYLRHRDLDEFDSASDRLNRQIQYLTQLFSQLKQTGAEGMVDAYEEIEDYLVTNIDFAKLAEEALSYEFDASRMYSVPGEAYMGTKFEEYYADETALYEMILDIFYDPVE